MTEQDYRPIPKRVKNLIGDRYGRWLVIGYAEKRGTRFYWECRCSCGNKRIVSGHSLRAGTSTNCGCKNRTHGLRGEPEYAVWRFMRQRCHVPSSKGYPGYGGRGIVVCKRWRDSFKNFYQDMGPRPSPEHSIERVSNDGPYSPENCRWATMKEQANNRRGNHLIAFNGKTQTISQWAYELGINHNTLLARLNKYKWPIEKALTTALLRQGVKR